jgi:hypothetical protein
VVLGWLMQRLRWKHTAGALGEILYDLSLVCYTYTHTHIYTYTYTYTHVLHMDKRHRLPPPCVPASCLQRVLLPLQPTCVQATIALYAGIFPAACLGALASWWRTRFFMVTTLNRFRWGSHLVIGSMSCKGPSCMSLDSGICIWACGLTQQVQVSVCCCSKATMPLASITEADLR